MQLPKLKFLTVIAAAAALAAALACGNDGSVSPTAADPPNTQPSTGITRSPDAAPNFTIPLYQTSLAAEGGEVSLADFNGRPVVINFWAPLCPPCRAEMPHFEEVWQSYKDRGVQFIGVDVGTFVLLGNAEQAIEFLNDIELSFPVGQAQDSSIITDYGVISMPTTVFLNPDGAVHRKWAGPLNRSTLESITEELLQ